MWQAIGVFIAAVVAAVGFCQFVVARQKVRLDLFDKRFAVYEELRLSIGEQLKYNRVSDADYFKFARAVSRAKFLFGSEVSQYLEERRKDLGLVTIEARNLLTDEQKRHREDEYVACLHRLGNFYTVFDALVLPYMQHTQKRRIVWGMEI
jgi:hypothetical protein